MIHRFLAAAAILVFAFAVSADDPQTVEQIEKKLAELQSKLAELKKQKATETGRKRLTFEDADVWRSFRGATPFDLGARISNDGKWLAFRVAPGKGDGDVIVRNLKTDQETRYPAGAGTGSLAFSFDSQWLAFSVTPESPRGIGAPGPRPKPKMVLIQLAKGQKTELEGVTGAQFSGEASTHIAFRKAKEAPAGPPTPTGPPAAPSVPSAPPSSASGEDLILRELASGSEIVLGNVSDYSFDKKGHTLVMLIDAEGQIGNGVQIRNMKTGVTTQVETDKAAYKSLTWHEDYDAFTVLKSVDDKDYEGKWTSIVAFSKLGTTLQKLIYDPKGDKAFPDEMGISTNRSPAWSKNLDALTFGIVELKKKAAPKKESAPTPKTASPPPTGGIGRRGGTSGAPSGAPSSGKPDLVIWHWKDERLQPMQQVQASADKAYSYLCVYHVMTKKFVRLADDACKTVSWPGQQTFAVGQDTNPYEYMSHLDGRRYADIYVIDPKTGGRQKALTKVQYYFGTSPSGTQILHYDDGHFFVFDMTTGKSTNITAKISATTFIDADDDHNLVKPPTRPNGWSKDGKFVLLSDDWDLWKVATDGSGGTNLTLRGKKDGIRFRGFNQFEPERKEPGIDFSKPAFTTLYGEWSKKEGIGRIDPDKPGVTELTWGDFNFGSVQKARDADVYFMTRETAVEAPNLYVADGSYKTLKKVSDSNPQQKNYDWTAGSKLVNYSALGKKLQAALFLPANYQPGKKYPTVVYIYEKLSDGLHIYSAPSTGGFNKSIYTSNGYAVLMPDITYKVNDPGKSSVECITAALDAAIATGIVDGTKLGLQGHSWGGYQTAYAITQTNRFKAACAGAPLTDLVSMYSSVYWNSGSANQPIFESSQGRFTAGYWDQQEAYIRNSPVYFAKNVSTPLLLLHNDKDGAVDFTQGIEYYNTLRRLQKPVVMLQYKGENHGLRKTENRLDYSKRMLEFFDHYLLAKSAPDWWKEGVPHLKMDEHLKGRK